VIKVPEGVPDEEALYVSDILVTSYNQVVDSGVKKGDIVGIWGAGAIGKPTHSAANPL
jgi:D-arabinose 1-dehydrogenase-like Zn-dependent alcohol dehydrogenase